MLIGSPSEVHADQGILAAARGLHVLVEKPIDVTVERADALIEAASRSGVRLGVMFQDRTQPAFVALQRSLVTGRLGRPLLTAATGAGIVRQTITPSRRGAAPGRSMVAVR